MTKSDSDWDRRRLCGDGNCIGVIGDDGYCRECGQADDGETADLMADAATPADFAGERVSDAAENRQEESETADASEEDWNRRTLCIDESCIGVVGPDGLCNQCGKPYPHKDDELANS